MIKESSTTELINKIRQFNRVQKGVLIKEDFNRFIWDFRNHYQSGRVYTFKKWLEVVEDLLDEIT